MDISPEKLAFEHCPDGVRVANLRVCIDLWRAEHEDESSIIDDLAEKLRQPCTLRWNGGLNLMRKLRLTLGNIGPANLLLLWLAAVHEDERYHHLSLGDIAKMVADEKISIADYMPLSKPMAA